MKNKPWKSWKTRKISFTVVALIWLLYAVTLAEKDLGGGTGKIKLRKVYDMFVEKYPVVSFLVSFDTFSKWVDVALDKMNEMLKENQALKAYVSDEKAELTDEEVENRIL